MHDLPFPSGASTGPSLPPTSACNRTWYELPMWSWMKQWGGMGGWGALWQVPTRNALWGFIFFSSPIWGTISAKLYPPTPPHPTPSFSHIYLMGWSCLCTQLGVCLFTSCTKPILLLFFSPKSKDWNSPWLEVVCVFCWLLIDPFRHVMPYLLVVCLLLFGMKGIILRSLSKSSFLQKFYFFLPSGEV